MTRISREKLRAFIIGANIIMAGIFLFSFFRAMFYDSCWFFPVFNFLIWMSAATSTVVSLKERDERDKQNIKKAKEIKSKKEKNKMIRINKE